jgi:peptide/nickel transport system substrate-binding protein
MNMKKNFSLVICILIISSMVLSACGSQTTGQGKYLAIAWEDKGTWVRNFNPFSATSLGSTTIAIYETLMIYNEATGKTVPWLATESSWNADSTVLTFKIRQNVQWSDGKPFTADDVAYTFNLMAKNSALQGPASPAMGDIDSIKAVDSGTVEFHFTHIKTLDFYNLIAQFIIPEHIWQNVADPTTWTNDNPVGTGPFTEVSKFNTQIYTLDRNPHYWQKGKPAFQGIAFPAFADNNSADLALANGDIDWAGLFAYDIKNIFVAKDPQHFHYYFPTANYDWFLYINPTVKPFDNPEVRKAVSMGINRTMIVNNAENGIIPASDATGLASFYDTWKDPAAVKAGTWTDYDVAKANQALDTLSFTKGPDGIRLGQDGKPMQYDLIVPAGWTDLISTAQIISTNMKDLGIKVNVVTPDENTAEDDVARGKFQWAISWSAGGTTPYEIYQSLMSSTTVTPVGEVAYENFSRYSNPEADKLLDQFSSTVDLAQQKLIADQLQMLFVNEAPALPLFPAWVMYEYSTRNFSGFPDANNNYAPGNPNFFQQNTPVIILDSLTPNK